MERLQGCSWPCGVDGGGGVPVVVQIVSQDAQQRVCKLLQGRVVALDLHQVVEQGLGGEVHLHASSRRGGLRLSVDTSHPFHSLTVHTTQAAWRKCLP